MPSLYIVSGERSGDRHGAGLMTALRGRTGERWEFSGLGGPLMHAIGAAVEDWVEEAGVVGLWEVLRKYGWFKRKFDATVGEILRRNPDAVVLIDYPGFNLRLAKALRAARFRGKVVYYISPQVWAWHRGRIPKMARMLDLMLCIFPFEKQLYEGCGLHTEFTGHPLVMWHRQHTPPALREQNLVGLFPGSRRREISQLFPIMLEAARLLHAQRPGLRFVASAASPALAEVMREMSGRLSVTNLEVQTGTAPQLMRQCSAGVVASGTATLEAAILGLPYCLAYKVAWPTYAVGKRLIRVPWLGIVNILAGRQIVREFVQSACAPGNLSAELLDLLENAERRRRLAGELAQVVASLGEGDAYSRAAEAVAGALSPGAPSS